MEKIKEKIKEEAGRPEGKERRREVGNYTRKGKQERRERNVVVKEVEVGK